MTKKVYPKGKALIEQFINTIGNYESFEVIRQDTICQFKFDGRCYYAYFKCISHEGNPYPHEHQRAQLPQRKEFNEVKESTIPFLFFGYDIDNDVYVCWEPHKIKPRLNKKSYVSFYSRLSAQQSVEKGKIKDEVLTNGDKFVLFKRTDIIPFLQMIDIHFPELRDKEIVKQILNESTIQYGKTINGKYLQGRIFNIEEDESVFLLVNSYPEDTPKLTIISECMNQFSHFYNKMQFSDWGKIIRAYLKKKYNE